ncbi:hypothetical protein OPT61_g6528 [Boeremia exigua]|uniref:Uncharacterized protein n=1 Tax=Boeremia exigua TaxID=749465 RepID=A0ACC2I6B5_9PLEO|nr:hypothetical protein OPT61_g6528 [Boeremia exigua]
MGKSRKRRAPVLTSRIDHAEEWGLSANRAKHIHLSRTAAQHHDDNEALRPHITHNPSSTHTTGRAAVAMSSKKHVLLQEPLQAVAEACARLERPPIPLARPGSVPPRAFRGEQARLRAATAEGTDYRDGESAREVEAPRPIPPTHGPRRLKVRAQPTCPDPGSSTEMDEPVDGWGGMSVGGAFVAFVQVLVGGDCILRFIWQMAFWTLGSGYWKLRTFADSPPATAAASTQLRIAQLRALRSRTRAVWRKPPISQIAVESHDHSRIAQCAQSPEAEL